MLLASVVSLSDDHALVWFAAVKLVRKSRTLASEYEKLSKPPAILGSETDVGTKTKYYRSAPRPALRGSSPKDDGRSSPDFKKKNVIPAHYPFPLISTTACLDGEGHVWHELQFAAEDDPL